eukprot:TRINITY_DN3811_c0_g1_i2.p2 TRINITY_DN3811_c0_g1~~TRINITY_DN3811_c0_g1_i2.p2  ORF type:complete len:417 (-),score=24.66 TRINITY_DN3811_c0_g1_i2:558-1808(-)
MSNDKEEIKQLENWEQIQCSVWINNQQQSRLTEGDIISLQSEGDDLGKLPGQAMSSEHEVEIKEGFALQSSSSSAGFDLEQFRMGNTGATQFNQKHLQGVNQFDNKDTVFSKVTSVKQEQIKICGVKFIVKYLQERYKYPIQLLQYVYGSLFVHNFMLCFVYLIGLKFHIFMLLICVIYFILSFHLITVTLNSSVKNGLKISKQDWFILFCAAMIVSYLAIYSFAFKTPFNSMPIFLLLFFVIFFASFVSYGMVGHPNERKWEDPNYQMRFLFGRVMMAFFNATGMVDVCSDIALCLDLIRYFRGYVFVIGIVLLGFCAIDYLLLIFRFLMPKKVTVRRHLFTILIELVVIILTVSVIFGVRKDMDDSVEGKKDSFAIILISIATTVVNFLHHIFLVYDQSLATSMIHANLSIMHG